MSRQLLSIPPGQRALTELFARLPHPKIVCTHDVGICERTQRRAVFLIEWSRWPGDGSVPEIARPFWMESMVEAEKRPYCWLLRKFAQRFFCAAAIRLRASGAESALAAATSAAFLVPPFRRGTPRPDADSLFGGRPAERLPIRPRTCSICSSSRCLLKL